MNHVLNHFLIYCIHLKLLFRMYLKQIFVLSSRSREVLHLKIERNFKNYLLINWRLNLKIVVSSPVRVKSFFTLKDTLPKMLFSGLAYKCKRGDCNGTYYGKTKRHFKVCICEHLDLSHLTGKKVKNDNNNITAIH